jgi:hypothetical protein
MINKDKDGIANAIKGNMDIFKAGIVNFLQKNSGITILRISNPEVRFIILSLEKLKENSVTI